MIKINRIEDQDFLNSYNESVCDYIKEGLREFICRYEGEVELVEQIKNIFTDVFVERLALLEPEQFESVSSEVYSKSALLAQAFNPVFCFDNFKASGFFSVGCEKKRIDIAKAYLEGNNLYYIEVYLDYKTSKRKKVDAKNRIYLEAFERMLSGEVKGFHSFNKDKVSWKSDFYKVFSWDKIRKEYSAKIASTLDLFSCPYCNVEKIKPFANFKPEKDHFYPKSIFPFFAISIHNLIPSCGTCNSYFKRDVLTFEHAHPFVDGVGYKGQLFKYNYNNVRKDTLEADDYKITIVKQCKSIDNNISTFSIEDRYNAVALSKLNSLIYRLDQMRERGELGYNSYSDFPELKFKKEFEFSYKNCLSKYDLSKFTVDVIEEYLRK